MKIEKSICLYMYSVNVEPVIKFRSDEKDLNADMMEKLRKQYFNSIIVSDTAGMIYTNRILDNISNFCIEVDKTMNNSKTTFSFFLTFVKALNISNMLSDKHNYTMLKLAFETIIKNSNKNVVQIRNGSYNVETALVLDLNKFCEIWSGWRDRVIISPTPEILLNVDLTYTSIIKKCELVNLIRKITKFDNLRDILGNKEMIEKVCAVIKNIEVKYKHISIKTKIFGLVAKTALTHLFDYSINGKIFKTNVEEYYQQKYTYALKYPEYPLVQMKPFHKKIYLPIELIYIDKIQPCLVEDQDITAKMIEYSACNSEQRMKSTNKLVKDCFDENTNKILKDFGIKIIPTMIVVEGAVNAVPSIIYGNAKNIPYNGSFIPQKNTKYYSTLPIKILYICNFTKMSKYKVEEFILGLIELGKTRGVCILSFKIENFEWNDGQIVEDSIKSINSSVDMIMMLVPNNITSFQYGNLKSVCDLVKGVVSQVVKEKTAYNISFPVYNNILLKINAKAGGINFCASISKSLADLIDTKIPYMVMGADVTHPLSASIDESSASLASVVSSHDINACKYTNQVVVNSRGKDVIDSMQRIIQTSLSRYEDKNKILPERIIMFRDGLSEGQFLEARVVELKDMQEGCKAYKQNYKPFITFICVQKRHHTRFYQCKDSNCPPGMFVDDQKICEPRSYYLLSHKNIKGTAKAAQYKIIHDDSNFSIQQLVDFSFILCHNFCRCTNSPPRITHIYVHSDRIFTEITKKSIKLKLPELLAAKAEMKMPKLTKNEYFSAKKAYFELLNQRITPSCKLTYVMYFV
ncbi:hypothetical protein MXB_5526 [Myxobolus squamalis]|nr:hypothetical protein MXB_5526 [Myxobolus squamalis]